MPGISSRRFFCSGALTLAAGVLLLTGPLPTQADIRYTTEMRMGGADAGNGASPGSPAIRTTTFVKDMRERVEQSMQFGPFKNNTVTLTLCDKHQSIKMDPALKIYTVGPIGALTFGAPGTGRRGPMGMPGGAMPEGKPGTGTVTNTFSVQDLGMDKVADVDAHHYKVNMHMQTSGCVGNNDMTMILDDWVSPIKGRFFCPERFSPSRTVPNERGCQITYEMKGDPAGMRDAFSGMVVRQIMSMGDKDARPVFQQDLRDYSLAALDDSLFTIPADFKQVSEQDYQKAERDAMMKNIMGGLGNTAPQSANPGDNASPNDNPAPSGDNSSQKQDKKKNKKPHIKIPGLPF